MKHLLLISILLSCGANENSKHNVIDVLKSEKHASENLKEGDVYNLDVLNGFKGVKLNSSFSDYDWSASTEQNTNKDDLKRWDIDSSSDGKYIRCFMSLYKHQITFAKQEIAKISLLYTDKKLKGIVMYLKDSLDSELQLLFGKPNESHIPQDSLLLKYFTSLKEALLLSEYCTPCFPIPKNSVLRMDYEFELDNIYGTDLENLMQNKEMLSEYEKNNLSNEQFRIIFKRIKDKYIYRQPSFKSAEDSYLWKGKNVSLLYSFEHYYHPTIVNEHESKSYDKWKQSNINKVTAKDKFPNMNFPHPNDALFPHAELFWYKVVDPKYRIELFDNSIISIEDWEKKYQQGRDKEYQKNDEAQKKKQKEETLKDL